VIDKSLYRDAAPSRAVALMKFRSVQHASEFLEEFNGRYFNSMEASRSREIDI
jgi:BRCA1-associated protein 2